MSDDTADETPGEYTYTKLTTKVKRGTGTRDQDTTKVVTRHPDPETAVARHMSAVHAAQQMADTTRRIQPEVADE
jgi:hypothetical protein